MNISKTWIIIIVLLAIAVTTNPTKDKHLDTVVYNVTDKDKLLNANPFLLLGLKVIISTFGQVVNYKDYVLFSVCEVNYEGIDKAISIGAFGNVYSLLDREKFLEISGLGNDSSKSEEKNEMLIPPYIPTNLNNEMSDDEMNDTVSTYNNIANDKNGDTSKTTNNTYPDYLIDLNQYSPKISRVCEDQGYSDCFRDATDFVKELTEIRNEHLNNEYNEEYLMFYNTKKAKLDKRSWITDAINIDTYIIENIDIYNEVVKECGYDEYDWFKQMPKNLYKHFNLNKNELLNNIKTLKN